MEEAVVKAEQPDTGRVALIMGAAQSVVWLVVGTFGVVKSLQFQRIFADFEAKLPAMTEYVINGARFLRTLWPLAVVAVLVWPGVVWAVDRLLTKLSEGWLLRVLWLIATWSAIPLAVAFLFVSLFFPMMSICQKLSE